jgi:hypothetical protein
MMQIRLIYIAMLTGIAFFLVVSVIMSDNRSFFKAELSDPIIVALLFLTIMALPAGYLVSKRIFARIDPSVNLNEKLRLYMNGQILRLALSEGVSLFSIVSLLITGNLFSMIFLAISLAVFTLYYPSRSRIATEINLTESEILELQQ